jgi:predicted RNA methylase
MPHGIAPPAVFYRASTNRLTSHDLGRFEGTSLFAKLGRAVCEAACLPRKELFEAWEMARRIRRRFRGGRVVDLAGGHGLLAQAMLLLDDSSPSAVVVDASLPPSAARLHASLVAVWPRLRDRVAFVEAALETVPLGRDDVIVSCHACGALTDRVLDFAVAAGARVAVLPCCHDVRDTPTMLEGWMDSALAQDVDRAQRLAGAGYEVWTQSIPADITPKNRLLVGAPPPRTAPPAR